MKHQDDESPLPAKSWFNFFERPSWAPVMMSFVPFSAT